MKKLNFGFTWLVRGAFVALMLALVVDSLGCAAHFGTIEAKDGSESRGVSLSLGNTTGPAGLEGAAISIPGATMVGTIFRTIGNVALALIPGGAAAVVVERPAEITNGTLVLPTNVPRWMRDPDEPRED